MSEASSQQRVGWFELFYDLIVVAAVAQSGKVFAAEPTWGTTIWITISLFTLFSIWLMTTFSRSLHAHERPWLWIVILVQMLAIIVAALAMARDGGLPDNLGFLALAVAFGTVALIYALVARRSTAGRATSRIVAISTASAAAILLIGAAVAEMPMGWAGNLEPWILAAGLITATLPFYTVVVRKATDAGLIAEEHLGERFGLLVIVVLGEGFISLVIKLNSASSIGDPLFFVLTMLVTFSIWVIYFQSVAPFGVPASAGRLRGWFAGHFVLLTSAIAASTAFAAVASHVHEAGKASKAQFWTSSPLLGVMVGLAILSALAPLRPHGVMKLHLIAIGALLILTIVGVTVLGSDGYYTLGVGGVVVILDAIAFTILAKRQGSLRTSTG